jgi:hypothetical protein
MKAVSQHVQAANNELTQTPEVGTDLRPGHRLRAEAMRQLREAARTTTDPKACMGFRAVIELFEQLLGR